MNSSGVVRRIDENGANIIIDDTIHVKVVGLCIYYNDSEFLYTVDLRMLVNYCKSNDIEV